MLQIEITVGMMIAKMQDDGTFLINHTRENDFLCMVDKEGKAHCRTSVKFLSETDAKSFDVIMTTCCKLNS